MPLDAIREIMGPVISMCQVHLESHKAELRKRIAQMERLINTVDDYDSVSERKKKQ